MCLMYTLENIVHNEYMVQNAMLKLGFWMLKVLSLSDVHYHLCLSICVYIGYLTLRHRSFP